MDAARRFPAILRVLLCCGVFAFLAHLPALRGGFVWDDIALEASLSGADRDQGLSGFQVRNPEARWIFRPVTTWVFAGTARCDRALRRLFPSVSGARQLGANRAVAFHLVSLLVHVLASVAVAAFVHSCLAGRKGATAGALLGGASFAVHPAHTENIAWIASLGDSLSTLLLLAALLLAAGPRRSPRTALSGGALFLAALLAKETAVCGLALLPLCLWVGGVGEREGPRGYRLPLVAFLAAAVLYLGLRFGFSEGAAGGDALVRPDVGSVVGASAFYVRKLFVPWPEEPYLRAIPAVSPVIILFIVAAVAVAIASHRRGKRLPLFCVAWFAVAISPTLALHFMPLTVTPVAERYLYLPSVAFAVAVGALAARRVWLSFPLAALAVAFTVTSFSNAKTWRTGVTLWSHVLAQEKTGQSGRPWFNLGYGYFVEDDLDKALAATLKARERQQADEGDLTVPISAALGMIRAKRGEMRVKEGNLRAALDEYRAGFDDFLSVAESGPNAVEALIRAGTVRVRIAFLEKTVAGTPEQPGLGQALQLFEKALELSPGNPVVGKLILDLKALGRP